MRLTHRLAALSVAAATIAGLVLAAPTGAAAHAQGCAVEHADRVTAEPDGATQGPFTCVDRVWSFDGMVTAEKVAVDAKGTLTVREFTLTARARRLTVADLNTLGRLVSGNPEVAIGRAVVATRSERPLTGSDIDTLRQGRDAGGSTVLRVTDDAADHVTLGELVEESGGASVMVVFSFLDRIGDAIEALFTFVVDVTNAIADWLEQHCYWNPGGPWASTGPYAACAF